MFSAFAYPYLVFQIVGGWISDRLGARRTLIVCGAVWAGATVLTGMAGGLASILAARVAPRLRRGSHLSGRHHGDVALGAKVKTRLRSGYYPRCRSDRKRTSPAVIVFIMSKYGWRQAFYVCAALSFTWVAIWALTFTDSRRTIRG